MKQSKRQARDRKRRDKEQASGADRPATAAACPSCTTPVRPDARFCHHCGAPLGAVAAAKRWHVPTVILYSIIVLSVIVVAGGVIFVTVETPVATRPPAASPAPAAGASQPVDLSRLSPREAADRLFNRVIMASEQGNMEEARQFAPMAIEAYEQVGRLDADAHYHMGLIYEVTDDFDNMRRQVGIIKQYTPDHLLGLILEHSIAEKSGNPFAAARAAEAFAAAHDAQIMTDRPEYEAHRRTIQRFRQEQAPAGSSQ